MDILDRINRSITTASNDDLSQVGSEKRSRHVERIDTMQAAYAEIKRHVAAAATFQARAERLEAENERLRAALAEMLVEFVAAHKAGHITTMPQTIQRIVRQAEAALTTEQKARGVIDETL